MANDDNASDIEGDLTLLTQLVTTNLARQMAMEGLFTALLMELTQASDDPVALAQRLRANCLDRLDVEQTGPMTELIRTHLEKCLAGLETLPRRAPPPS